MKERAIIVTEIRGGNIAREHYETEARALKVLLESPQEAERPFSRVGVVATRLEALKQINRGEEVTVIFLSGSMLGAAKEMVGLLGPSAHVILLSGQPVNDVFIVRKEWLNIGADNRIFFQR